MPKRQEAEWRYAGLGKVREMEIQNSATLTSAIEGGGLSWLYAQQATFVKNAEDLKNCSTSDRQAFQRCQLEMMCILKPYLLLAAEATIQEVRNQCIEALIQTTLGNTELAALMGRSGLFDMLMARALRPTDSLGQSQEYIAGLTLELEVAKAVPEAPVHLQVLPYIARILQDSEQLESEVRQYCVEVLTYLSYARHRCMDVAAVLSPTILTMILQTKSNRDSIQAASQGKANLSESMTMSEDRKKSIRAVAGMDFSDNLEELKAHCTRTSFSVGMRHFSEIVRRSTIIKDAAAADMNSVSANMDGHQFYVGLLMANLCDMAVPGTNRTFGSFAEKFWKRIMFFPGIGLCLGAVVKGQPWPPLWDGEHQPRHILSACLKLASGGYVSNFVGIVEPLAAAIRVSSPEAEPKPTASDVRVGRLAAVVLRSVTSESKHAQSDLWRLIQEKDGPTLLRAIEALVPEEPAARDLLDAREAAMRQAAIAAMMPKKIRSLAPRVSIAAKTEPDDSSSGGESEIHGDDNHEDTNHVEEDEARDRKRVVLISKDARDCYV